MPFPPATLRAGSFILARPTRPACYKPSNKSKMFPDGSGRSIKTTWSKPAASRENWPTTRCSGSASEWLSPSCWRSVLAFHTIRTILRPIQAVTHSALAIGAGNLDQVVPVTSRDELGQLAGAFNTMGRQLRLYRQTGYSRLLRAQRTSQATVDSFPDPVVVLDSEGRVEMANPAARRTIGRRAASGRCSRFVVPWQPPEALRAPLDERHEPPRRLSAGRFRSAGDDLVRRPAAMLLAANPGDPAIRRKTCSAPPCCCRMSRGFTCSIR